MFLILALGFPGMCSLWLVALVEADDMGPWRSLLNTMLAACAGTLGRSNPALVTSFYWDLSLKGHCAQLEQ